MSNICVYIYITAMYQNAYYFDETNSKHRTNSVLIFIMFYVLQASTPSSQSGGLRKPSPGPSVRPAKALRQRPVLFASAAWLRHQKNATVECLWSFMAGQCQWYNQE